MLEKAYYNLFQTFYKPTVVFYQKQLKTTQTYIIMLCQEDGNIINTFKK